MGMQWGVMAVSSQCPYDPGCDAPCTGDEVGRFIELTVDPERRLMLAMLADLQGTWLSVDDFVVHLDALGATNGPDYGPAELEERELPRLEELGLVAHDADDGRFRYHGCPLVEDIVEMVTH